MHPYKTNGVVGVATRPRVAVSRPANRRPDPISGSEFDVLARELPESPNDRVMATHDLGTRRATSDRIAVPTAGATIGVCAIPVHAISEEAKAFHEGFAFRPSPIEPMTSMVTLAEVERMLQVDRSYGSMVWSYTAFFPPYRRTRRSACSLCPAKFSIAQSREQYSPMIAVASGLTS